MIPHHQGAVDMARIQLKYGTDGQLKRLSRDIIRAQNREIWWMEKRLQQHEARLKGHHDIQWLGGDHEGL